jgi:hypothetical protein
MLGKLLGGVEGRSLQFIGLGMYEKFPQALKMLQDWMSQTESDVIVLGKLIDKVTYMFIYIFISIFTINV